VQLTDSKNPDDPAPGCRRLEYDQRFKTVNPYHRQLKWFKTNTCNSQYGPRPSTSIAIAGENTTTPVLNRFQMPSHSKDYYRLPQKAQEHTVAKVLSIHAQHVAYETVNGCVCLARIADPNKFNGQEQSTRVVVEKQALAHIPIRWIQTPEHRQSQSAGNEHKCFAMSENYIVCVLKDDSLKYDDTTLQRQDVSPWEKLYNILKHTQKVISMSMYGNQVAILTEASELYTCTWNAEDASITESRRILLL
jgi:hypothetical protein